MAATLEQCLEGLRHAPDIAGAAGIAEEYLTRQGLGSFLFYDPGRPLAQSAIIRNFDMRLMHRLDDSNVWRVDPLRLQTTGQPVIWDDSKTGGVEREAREMVWEPMMSAGFHHVIAVPIHGPQGMCNALSVMMRGPSCGEDGAGRLIDQLIPIAYNLASVVRRESAPDAPGPISAREAECLRWTAEGKTAWEISAIIGLTERTVNYHLQSAMRKFGCRSKHQAALKAMKLNLLG